MMISLHDAVNAGNFGSSNGDSRVPKRCCYEMLRVVNGDMRSVIKDGIARHDESGKGEHLYPTNLT